MICELPTTPTPPAPHSNGSTQSISPSHRLPVSPSHSPDILRQLDSPEPLLSTSAPSLPSVPSCLSASVPDLPDLTPRDESLILALLDADMSIAAVSRTEQTTLTALLRWSWQPHIRAWLAVLSDLGSLRAKALAANHSAAAVRTLLSANHLADADFYEQADPAARIRSFESGRKAAAQLLRLAQCSSDLTPSPPSPPSPTCPNPKSPIQNPKPPNPLSFDGRLRPRRKRPSRASARTLARRARNRHRSEPPHRTIPPYQISLDAHPQPPLHSESKVPDSARLAVHT